MSSTSSQTNAVRRNDEKNRYELSVDGQFAGFAAYADQDGQRVFYHTEIEPAFEGHGLSSVLVRAALDDVRDSGKRAVGVCPVVARYVSKHPEYHDITDPVTPEVLQGLETTLG